MALARGDDLVRHGLIARVAARRDLRLLAALALLAALLIAPIALREDQNHSDLWIAWVWTDQFATGLAHGELYPRWLPRSHDGLGSPVFYFYPPAAFYVAALFRLFGLTTPGSVIAAFAASYLLSGLAMYAFLREIRALRPELGAIMYVALPYHLVDFVVRGAVAEHLAYAWIPLVALGLVRSRARGDVVLLALALAGLILTHLPVALLVCVFMIAPVLLATAIRTPRRLAAMLPAIALGIALAAVFLVPALALERFRDAAALWTRPGLKPSAWSVWNIGAFGPDPGLHFIILLIAGATALPALLLDPRRGWRLATYALAILAMAIALVPALWTLPLLAKVQFPFRILPLAEFTVCAALACARAPLLRLVPLFAPALGLSAVLLAVEPQKPPANVSMAVIGRYADVPENLPPGRRRLSWPSFWALDLAARPPVSSLPGWTAAPIFYFPIWTAQCRAGAGATRPDPRTGLLLYRGDGCRIVRVTTGPEALGLGISLAAALSLAGWGLVRRRRSGAPA